AIHRVVDTVHAAVVGLPRVVGRRVRHLGTAGRQGGGRQGQPGAGRQASGTRFRRRRGGGNHVVSRAVCVGGGVELSHIVREAVHWPVPGAAPPPVAWPCCEPSFSAEL